MNPLMRALPGLLIAFVTFSLCAEDLSYETQEGVLVLRNGFVIRGRVTPLNDTFLVTLPEGGEVRLSRSEVALQCRDLDDAYLQQRDLLPPDDPEKHLQLADWCVRHGLLDRAADQLLAVFAHEPAHPRLRILEQRLVALGTQPTESSTPLRSEKVVAKQMQAPSTSHRLSAEAMSQFAMVVQPILLNRCATYACHGNGSQARYRLIRPSTGHATTSRMTQRNLHATLAFTDSQRPENSELLVQGKTAHGGAVEPPFTDKQANQLELLEMWLRRSIARPATSIASNRGGAQRSRIPATTAPPATPSQPAGAVASTGVHSAAPTVAPAMHASPTADKAITSATGDPFDPEIFNRRFHPEPVTQEEPTAPAALPEIP